MNIFSKLQFRNKLLLTFLLVLIPLALIASIIAYVQVKKILETSINNQLNSTKTSFVSLIRTSAQISVKNRLRAIAEKNLDIARYYFEKYEAGSIDKDQAESTIKEIFLSQPVGKTGYIYCLKTNGVIAVHPKPGVLSADLSEYGFIQRQIEMKQGYLEYEWKNPGEEKERPKALYMVYFEPLDWIISVSSYRDEFNHLVDIEDLRQSILYHKHGKTGYGFVMDENGQVLIHPQIARTQYFEQKGISKDMVVQMVENKMGKVHYFWKDPGEKQTVEKVAVYEFLPKFRWVVACAKNMDEIYAPLNTFKWFLICTVFIILAIFSAAAFLISRTVTRPLEHLVKNLESGAKGDFTVRMIAEGQDEFGQLSQHFNQFMDQLENDQKVIEEQNKRNLEARNALVENDLKLRSLFNQSFQYTGIISPTGILEEVNQSGLDFAGCSAEEITFLPFWHLPWWRHDINVQKKIKEEIKKAGKGEFVRFETTSMSHNGDIREIDLTIKPVFNSSGDVVFIITEGRDITEYKLAAIERKNLAVQMEKAQKMESIGTLAGGIAHDFNNILSGILGYAQLAELNLDEPAKAKGHIELILKGARRAARLTQQILTFSRQHEYEKMAIELGLIVKETLKLLRSSIPVTIAIEEDIETQKMVFADPTQMHQVIMNLCTNAYHAIGSSPGILRVTLREKRMFQQIDFFENIIKNGDYLVLKISDTGSGMPPDIMSKAFDPYFTTKDVGKGTGFGLALVHAIVEEHDGHINLTSTVNKGSVFSIYLPVVDSPVEGLVKEKNDKSIIKGTEKIMVVDDEEDIRAIVKQFLESNGYTVEVFNDGSNAWEAFQENPDRFDLIITDMTMPNMTGDELSRKVLNLKKDMPIILCTGYSETVPESTALEIGIRKYVQKPLTNEDLAEIVRKVLDEQPKD